MGLIFLLLFLGIALTLPFVQTKLARVVTNKLNESMGTEIYVDKVAITIFGGVTLQGVNVLDNHDKTFININHFNTNILDLNLLLKGKLYFGKASMDGLYFNIHTYKGETKTNFDLFIEAFDDGQPGDGSFRLSAQELKIRNSHFVISDDNHEHPVSLDLKELNASISKFLIKGPEIYADIKSLQLVESHGLSVRDLKAEFAYTQSNISLEKLVLRTKESVLAGNIQLDFQGDDMKYFVDRVKLDVQIDKASIATNDINLFYPEFGAGQKFFLKTQLKGVMNDFTLTDLKLIDDHYSEVIGYFRFQNIFGNSGPFRMDTQLDRLSSTYYDLKELMPNVLGKLLPVELTRLGSINLSGTIGLTKKTLDTDIDLISSAGRVTAKVGMTNIDKIEDATYVGKVALVEFNLGEILANPSFGKTNLDIELDGRGFSEKYLNTSLVGKVTSFAFQGYNYQHIEVDGTMRMPYFKGYLNSNDPNLKLAFDGLIDLSSKVKNYDFTAKIDYADLHKLHFVKDTLAIFKGDLSFKATGNTLDDLAGAFHIENAMYQNKRDQYLFEDFTVNSSFSSDGVRTISLSSQDAIEGQISGRFEIEQMGKIIENALGSLYTNYSSFKVKPNQYFDFDFTINSHLIEIFLPKLTVKENSRIRGNINADEGDFKLKFSSSGVAIDNVAATNIQLNVNNQNPLYNAFVSIDSVKTKGYSISDFNLINVTQNDTLFFRTEFKGGKHGKDYFNLNLYHTINPENQSVVGFKKSELNFKDYLWYLNESDDEENKIVFNKKLTDFKVDKMSLTHDGQLVELSGVLRDSTYKDLKLSFNGVDLNKITPELNNMAFGGNINGSVNFEQKGTIFHPSSDITIDGLMINKVALGNMIFMIDGDEKLQNFKVNSSIVKDHQETFFLNGDINIVGKNSLLNLNAGFNKFDIKTIGPLLSSIVSDVRGNASGRISILGTHLKPEIDGRLYLDEAGMKSKFTGVDYNFEHNSALDLTQEQFILRNVKLIDSKYKTSGILKGAIKHKKFDEWNLDLHLSSDNLLGLDTPYAEGSVYYGTAYINGTASITGPVNLLSIMIKATSNKGTSIKIPLNEAQGVGDNSFIHFLSPQEKANRLKGLDQDVHKYSGIELDFEFVVTPDAEIEIILDRESGHAMKGRGAGFITMEINTLGKFNMWGDFQAYEGEYNFKYGGIIDKRFEVKKFGTIRWDGDPMNAALDLQAIYHTEANPSVIIDNAILNRKVPTEVSILLNGSLSSPEVDFEINFPNVSSVVKSEIDYKLSDKDTRERQAMALLATGSFFSSDNASSLAYGSLFERASSIFDDLFSDSDDKFKVGLNYAQADRNPYAQSEGRVGVTFSTKVNERISVNGKLGVPVGGAEESVIVGDVEVLLRLNDDGTLNARVFNRENDINYIGEGIGYTQGVGLSYEVDFDTFRALIRRILNRAAETEEIKKKDGKNAGDELPDSDYSSEFIRFYENRRQSTPSAEPQDIDSE
ncbi:translocation/assembly module TamB domain-containing protein [Flavobacterium sp. NKUCC04_CG]|uniref:translocation/assembly module TamB domain-containing protein n=1 Tax=Flavobacterium sp. NKUCC04_CG TaxID=2842121 RepID=UPI00210537BC|nr:translocation/assembly module TamB domain-containing protein [Flavobacterium sp. NKUCC04_CG]